MLRALNLLFALLFVLGTAACDSSGGDDPPPPPPPPPATTGTVSGVISLPPGTAGAVGNTRVALYQSFDDWQNDRFALQVGAGADGSYTLTGIVPGTYYMDAWKDNDNSTTITVGDFFGVWGSFSGAGANLTPISVSAGSSTTISFQITQLTGALAPRSLPEIR